MNSNKRNLDYIPQWIDEKTFTVNSIKFRTVDIEGNRADTPGEHLVFKNKWMIESYLGLFSDEMPKTIFELGIHRGGSTVLFNEMFRPKKLVAIDIAAKRRPGLDAYISSHSLEHSVKAYYGVDQSDSDTMNRILRQEFGDDGIDLVVDDASHFLNETRTSFNLLFPHLNPGAIYVIEDWSWAHGKIGMPDDYEMFYPNREPLTKLVFELVLACPSTQNLIESVYINRNNVVVHRGSGIIETRPFDIAKCSLARGRALIN